DCSAGAKQRNQRNQYEGKGETAETLRGAALLLRVKLRLFKLATFALDLFQPFSLLGRSFLVVGFDTRIKEPDRGLEFRIVAVSPNSIRPLFLAPVDGDFQKRSGEQTFLAASVKQGRLGQASIDTGRLRLLLDPGLEPLPVSNKAFMRDVDYRIRLERSSGL